MALASNPGLVLMPDAKTEKKELEEKRRAPEKKGEGNKKKQVGGPPLLPFSLRPRASFLLFRSFFSRLRLRKGAGSPPPFSSSAADTNNGWPKTEIEIHGKGGKRERERGKEKLSLSPPLPTPGENNGKCTIKRDRRRVGGGRKKKRRRKNVLSLSLCGVSPRPICCYSPSPARVCGSGGIAPKKSPPLSAVTAHFSGGHHSAQEEEEEKVSAPIQLTTAFKRRGNKTTLGAIIASGHKRLSSSSPSFCLPLSLLFFSYFFSHRSRYNSDQALQPNKKGSLSSEECEPPPLLFGLLLSFWGPTTTTDSSSLLFLWFFSEPEAAWSVV